MKILKIYVCIAATVVAICLMFINLGRVTLIYNGFAIDSDNVLYIGKDEVIEKYKEGELIGKINPKTSRAYAFTIEDDIIILSTSSIVYTLDLHGNVITEKEDIGTKTFNKLERKKNVYVSDGKTYKLKSNFGRLSIKNEYGNVLYEMPIMDYIIKLMFGLVFISVFIFVPIIVKKTNQRTHKNTGDG